MLKISKLADYAVVALAALMQSEEEMLSASCLAERGNLPEPTVSKVMKLLCKANIVKSIRGANGGYQFTKDPTQLAVSAIVTAIDGPISIAACCDDEDPDACDKINNCVTSGRWTSVNNAVKTALEEVKLPDMMPRQNGAKG